MELVNTFKQFWKPRKIAENYDLYSVLESVWIWKIFGTIINVPKGPIGERKYVISIFFIVYNFLLLCVYFGAFTERFWDKFWLEYKQKHLALDGNINIYMRQYLNLCTMIEFFFWKLIINKQFIEICDLIDTQDKILKYKLHHEINYKSHIKKNGIYAGCYIFAHILMSFQQLSYGFSFSLFVDYCSWWLPIIIQKSNLCLFMSLILMLGVRFNALNKKLGIIIKSSALTIRYSQTTLFSESHIEIFRTVASMHGILCKIGERINHIFILALVQCVLEAFVYVTLVLYSLMVEAQKTVVNVSLFFTYFILLFSCCSTIFMIVMICNWTSRQVSDAKNLIYKIRVQKAENTLFQLIQEFSMQMLHQKLSFSIGGLFSLDPALLQAMTGVITRYLVILIQFGQTGMFNKAE